MVFNNLYFLDILFQEEQPVRLSIVFVLTEAKNG